MERKIRFWVVLSVIVGIVGITLRVKNDSQKVVQAPGENFTGEKISTGDIIANLPLCTDNLVDVEAINMDDLVTNCTSVEKVGKMRAGGGGDVTDYRFFKEGAMQTYRPDAVGTPICKVAKDENSLYQKVALVEGSSHVELNITPTDLVTLDKVASLGLLSSMYKQPLDSKYTCDYTVTEKDGKYTEIIDPDCADMHGVGVYTSGDNYFVAGFRGESIDSSTQLYYVVNDQLYYPGEDNLGSISEEGTQDGRWEFVDVRDDKMIVKRITNMKITPQATSIANDGFDRTTYTLQTCEISL